MKALIVPNRHNHFVRVEFDREIPDFPGQNRRSLKYRVDGLLFSRDELLSEQAAGMATMNAGKLPIEFSANRTDVFLEFLRTLLEIDGFVGIRFSDRYGLDAVVGKLFNSIEVGQKIALAVQSHFYSKEKIVFVQTGNSVKAHNTTPETEHENANRYPGGPPSLS